MENARFASKDVGTQWTLQRDHRDARCALIRTAEGWEVRVIVSNRILRSDVCDRAEEAFALGSEWCRQMVDEGWSQVVPSSVPESSGLQARPRGRL